MLPLCQKSWSFISKIPCILNIFRDHSLYLLALTDAWLFPKDWKLLSRGYFLSSSLHFCASCDEVGVFAPSLLLTLLSNSAASSLRPSNNSLYYLSLLLCPSTLRSPPPLLFSLLVLFLKTPPGVILSDFRIHVGQGFPTLALLTFGATSFLLVGSALCIVGC